MNSILYILSVFWLITGLSPIGSTQDLKESPPTISIAENFAKPGDIFVGVIYKELGKELYLDLTPCEPTASKRVKAFVKPYKKTKLNEQTTCEKGVYQLTRVEKK